MTGVMIFLVVLITGVPGRPDFDGTWPMRSVEECLEEMRGVLASAAETARNGGRTSVMCDVIYPETRDN